MIMVIMTLLGLAFMLVGQTEANIARNKRDTEQALFTAEGGARIVKKWFEAPSGTSSYLVPTTSQMNRTLRYVDDNSDGTYGAYSTATSPYNVTYRQGTDDPFEKPYRGTPALATSAPRITRISGSPRSAPRENRPISRRSPTRSIRASRSPSSGPGSRRSTFTRPRSSWSRAHASGTASPPSR